MTTSLSRLPKAYSSFIGRRGEVARITNLLSTTRLLTLTGPGGSGKTRIALQTATEIADRFDDGVYWADLAPLSNQSYLPQAVAAILGSSEQPGRPAADGIIDLLRQQKALLVLDNCEHVLDGCAALASAILAACPETTLLATSLQPLGLPQEYVWQVPPLALAEADSPIEKLEECDSVRLFVTRAAEAFPGFALDAHNAPIVASICRRLDGLPLAIELAAARMKLLTVEQIAKRLDSAITLLTHGKSDTVPRHQALRATLDWAFQFLSDAEQTVLQRLSVFAGPFTLEMVESVCANEPGVLDLLTGIVEKSFVLLLPREGQTEAGYRLLEVVRQYAREKLEASGHASAVRDSYLDWGVEWAVHAEPHLTRPEQIDWLKRFEWNQEHFRACLRWACTGQRVERGMRLAIALSRYWLTGGMEEGRGWLEELLNLDERRRETRSHPATRETRAWALCMSGRLAVRQGDDDHGKRRGEESLLQFRAAEDKSGIVTALNLLALVAQDTADYTHAVALYQEALNLSRETDNPRMTGVLLNNLGLMYYERQDYRRTAPMWEEANAIGARFHFLISLDNLGCLAMMQGDLERAQDLLEREHRSVTETGDKHGVALVTMDLGEVARRQGDLGRAQLLLQDALVRHQQMSNSFRIGENLVYLGDVARNLDHWQEAKRLYESALPFLEKSRYTRYVSRVKTNLGLVEAHQGDAEKAMGSFCEGLQTAQQGDHRLGSVEALEGIAGVWAREGQFEHAAHLVGLSAAERERLSAPIAPVERSRHDQLISALRAELGDRIFESIQSNDRTTALERVAAEILGEQVHLIGPRSEEEPTPLVVPAPGHELEIYALGASRIVVGDRVPGPADWKYAKSKELLYYLVFNSPASKARIGLDLWPDASPKQLRNNLHQAMYHLRHALGDPAWIVFVEGAYSFNQERNYWCDARELESRLGQARWLGAPESQSPYQRSQAISHIEAAARLWQGDFLQDLDAGEWAIYRRESLHQSFLRALMDLAQMYMVEARYDDAAATFQRALAIDNYLEGAHRGLMRAYARQGDTGRALKHYRDLRRMMREELGGEPSPETLLLHERLRRGDDV